MLTPHTLSNQSCQSLSAVMPNGDADAIVRSARELAQLQAPEQREALLRHRNVALISEQDDPSHNVFCLAALELGARVSHIRPSLTDGSTPEDIQQTARMLGRLYSACEWPDISLLLLDQVRKEAGVPIYGGISRRGHAIWQWASELDMPGTPDEKRRHVIQAILLRDLR